MSFESACKVMIGGSVSAITWLAQGRLRPLRQDAPMKAKSDPLTPAERIAWAIDRSGKTLVQIADEIGCSHAALSQWASAKTAAENIKAGLLQRFADAVAVEIRWLLTGDGPTRTHYPAHHHSFIQVAREIDEMEGPLPSQAERLLRALLPDASSH